NWDLGFPELKGCLSVEGYSTGSVKVELIPGDVPHVDSFGTSWGPVVEGMQFGIRLVPTGPAIEAGESIRLTTYARNWSDTDVTFELPQPEFLAQLGVTPTVRDASWRAMELIQPARDSLPKPRFHKFDIPVGQQRELSTSQWLLLLPQDRSDGTQPYFI